MNTKFKYVLLLTSISLLAEGEESDRVSTGLKDLFINAAQTAKDAVVKTTQVTKDAALNAAQVTKDAITNVAQQTVDFTKARFNKKTYYTTTIGQDEKEASTLNKVEIAKSAAVATVVALSVYALYKLATKKEKPSEDEDDLD